MFLTPFWVKNSVLGVPVGSGVRFGVEKRRGRRFGSGNSNECAKLEETDDAGPSQRSPRTVHTFAVWAATRLVPTGELRRERSFRVGACGRRPLESADPGVSASWALYRASIGCTIEKKLYGGRGLGLVRCPHVAAEVSKIDGFIIGK